MSAIFGGKPKMPSAPPAPKSTDLAEENAANAQRLRMQRAKGRQSTMLTQGMDMGAAPMQRRSLLGG